MVRRRVRVARGLRSSIRADGQRVARGLEERMAKVLEPGEKAPDVRHFLDVVGRMIQYEAMELGGSDDWRWDETFDLEELQREYRQTAESFRAWLVGLRKQLRGLVGDDETRRLLELQGRTPRSQEELADYAEWLYHRMAIWKMPRLRYRAAASHKVWRAQLRPMVEKLSELSRRLAKKDAGRSEALDVRDLRLAEFTRDFRRAFRWVQLCYLLAGEDRPAARLGNRLHRSLRSRGLAVPDDLGLEPEEAAGRRWWPGAGERLASWWARGWGGPRMWLTGGEPETPGARGELKPRRLDVERPGAGNAAAGHEPV